MVVKVKEKFEKTRHIKKMTNLKSVYYEERKTQDIMKKYYQKKRNFIISILFLIQHNHILSRLTGVYKKHMTSVAKDLILVRHQTLNKITKIQIVGCKYFLSCLLNYMNIIIYFYSFI